MKDNKITALAKYLDVEPHTITDLGDNRYVVMIDDEAQVYDVYDQYERFEAASDYIRESMFAFTSAFLSSYTGFPEIIFEKLSELCEDANEAILALVEHDREFDTFVDHAIAADGYGVYLAGYDHDQHDLSDGLYAYRVE